MITLPVSQPRRLGRQPAWVIWSIVAHTVSIAALIANRHAVSRAAEVEHPVAIRYTTLTRGDPAPRSAPSTSFAGQTAGHALVPTIEMPRFDLPVSPGLPPIGAATDLSAYDVRAFNA